MVGKYTKYRGDRYIKCKDKLREISFPLIMGIVNVTPDSFYTESRMDYCEKAFLHAKNLINDGADIIDIGGISTRPGADLLTAEEEIQRILPVIQKVRHDFPTHLISVDTFRSEIAKIAVENGADMINDVYGGKYDDKMMETVAKLDVPYILMHCRGTAKDMQDQCNYSDVTAEVIYELSISVRKARACGIKDVIIDPGFGFAKNTHQNYQLFNRLGDFTILDCPLLVGVSRKSMLYKLLETTADKCLNGTTVLHTLAMQENVSILRVHDVKEAIEVRKISSMVNEK